MTVSRHKPALGRRAAIARNEAIKNRGAEWRYLGSMWLVETNLSASAIWRYLAPNIDKTDLVLVICVTRDYNRWLPQDAWGWINVRSSKMPA